MRAEVISCGGCTNGGMNQDCTACLDLLLPKGQEHLCVRVLCTVPLCCWAVTWPWSLWGKPSPCPLLTQRGAHFQALAAAFILSVPFQVPEEGLTPRIPINSSLQHCFFLPFLLLSPTDLWSFTSSLSTSHPSPVLNPPAFAGGCWPNFYQYWWLRAPFSQAWNFAFYQQNLSSSEILTPGASPRLLPCDCCSLFAQWQA